MPKDIRSFFKPISSVKRHHVNSSDDDVIPESPDVQVKIKKKESKKRMIVNDASDDEEIFSKKTKESSINKEKLTPNSKRKKSEKNTLKEAKPFDIFGSGPIKRTEPIVKKERKRSKTETGIHSDEEFEKSLLELDHCTQTQDSVPVKVNPNEEDITILNEPSGSSSSKYFEGCTQNGKSSKTGCTVENKAHKSRIKTETTKDDLQNDITEYSTTKSEKPSCNGVKDASKQTKELTPKSKTVKDVKAEVMNENKRNFAEFIDNKIDDNHTNDNDHNLIPSSKRRKVNKSLNESVISDEERYEKKRHSAILYQSYLNRSGPKHLGAKQIPEGSPDCLKNCSFLLTGVLDSFEREEISETITKYGGTIKSGVTKKVTHVLAGDDAGPSKLAKAEELKIKVINEDDFIQMIKDLSKAKKNDSSSNKKSQEKLKSDNIKSETKNSEQDKKVKSTKVSADKMTEFEATIQKNFYSKNKTENKIAQEIKSPKEIKDKIIENEDKVNIMIDKQQKIENKNENTFDVCTHNDLWVEKYKPQNLKQIIGQHGDSSNVKKLTNWLTKWYINRKEKIAKPSPWAKNNDGSYYKAALLSGPPGVGKTTTVSLVCKELGFDMVEFNASDTRSKNLIKQQISELLTTSSLSGYAKGDTSKKAVTKKHVLIMDEVDGMAGNEDRGGLQELISLIKISAVPVICMCNDRNSTKMRSLVNYCYDLKFSRPRVDQIRSAMLSVCYKEGVKIHPEALSQLIVASNQDVRQTLHLLSMWSVDCKQMATAQVTKDAANAKKDTKLGPWEAVRKVFSAEDHKTMTTNDRSDLFFYDYSLAPLFVQENYLQVTPHCPKNEIMDRFSMAADSISLGDVVEKKVRSQGAWNLLPVQAMYSSVLVGHALSGHVSGQIQFPAWLGKNSRAGKLRRLCQEIHAHTRLSTTGSKSSIYLDYCSHLRNAVVSPLVSLKAEGIPQTMEVLQSYNLLREDLDSLTELSLWPGQRDPMLLVDSKVKAAMTRAYNKEAVPLPYAPVAAKRSRTAATDEDEDTGLEEDNTPSYGENEDQAASDSDPENDAFVKKKKKQTEKVTDIDKPSTSKGKKKVKNNKS